MNIKKWFEPVKRLLLFAFLLRLALVLLADYHPDLINHLDWGERFWDYGPRAFYSQSIWRASWPNQPPGTIYLFAFLMKLYQKLFSLAWWLNLKIALFPSFIFPFLEKKLPVIMVKLPFILADLALGWLIYQLVAKELGRQRSARWASGLFLFNPALIYNSTIWGQTDSLINFLALLSFWAMIKRCYFWAAFTFCLSLYFKLSLIIWAPVLVLMIL